MIPLLPFVVLAHAADPPTPAEVRWNHRLIVLVADDPDEPRLAASRTALEAHPEGAAERKLQLVTVVAGEVTGLDVSAASLASQWDFGVDAAFMGLLVGLDGTVKDRTSQAVDVEAWFRGIDSMPMRRAELQQ